MEESRLLGCIYQNKQPELEIRIPHAVTNFRELMKRFFPGVDSQVGRKVQTFAEASYVRYGNFLLEQARYSDPVKNWYSLVEEGLEACLLAEAWSIEGSVIGAKPCSLALIRSGWNGDLIFDYVARSEDPEVKKNIRAPGLKTVFALLAGLLENEPGETLFRQVETSPPIPKANPRLLWVETCKESESWWRGIGGKTEYPLLTQGSQFIKFELASLVMQRLSDYFASNGVFFDKESSHE